MVKLDGDGILNPTFDRVVKSIFKARTTIVIGSTDTGKTTFIRSMANEIFRAGKSCAIVDADMGQSDIGPPTTIGLGWVRHPIDRMDQVDVIGIYFVGSISPKGHLLQTIVGTKRMVDKAILMGFDHILIDTTGLVNGPLGQSLKGHKIELIQPELMILLQHGSELEYLLRRFSRSSKYPPLVLFPSRDIRKKPLSERREYRKRAFINYFADKSRHEVDLNSIFLVDFPFFSGESLTEKEKEVISKKIDEVVLWAESLKEELLLVTIDQIPEMKEKNLKDQMGKEHIYFYKMSDFKDVLAGLYDSNGEFFSLAVVKEIDFFNKRAILDIAHPEKDICGIRFSRYRIDYV